MRKSKGPAQTTKLGSWSYRAPSDLKAPPRHQHEQVEKRDHLTQDGAKIGLTKTAATKECALAVLSIPSPLPRQQVASAEASVPAHGDCCDHIAYRYNSS